MKLSVVIPVYNEEKTIAELLKKVISEKTDKEIIVIDDGSTDETLKRVQSLKCNPPAGGQNCSSKFKIICNGKNKGKGYSVRRGIENATGDVLIIQDADLEYDPNDYQKLLKPIIKGETKVVYGSRLKNLKLNFFGKNKTPLPLHYLVNRFLSFLTNVLYGSRLTDMETCYKMLSREVYQKLNLVSDRFEIEPEIAAKILKNGFKIKEIPIYTNPRGYADGKKIRAKDAVFAIWALFRFKFFTKP